MRERHKPLKNLIVKDIRESNKGDKIVVRFTDGSSLSMTACIDFYENPKLRHEKSTPSINN